MDKAKTARRVFQEEGNDWTRCRNKLIEVLGSSSSKRSTVNRWITVARDLGDPVLEFIKSRKDLPQKMTTDNKDLVGTGPDK
eukprot:13040804-Alexandrium_andersonii.AAC.1